MSPIVIAHWSVFGLAIVVSTLSDLRSRRIPDAVTYPSIAALLALRFLAEGLGDLNAGLVSGAVAALGAAGLFSLWAFRGRMGWGDVKLVAVVGAAFGFPGVMAALIFISLAGAAQAIASLILKGEALAWLKERAGRIAAAAGMGARPEATQRHIPYAVAIALGSAWALWWDSAV